jgi:hypothetical protein
MPAMTMSGMTINERLFATGNLEAFDDAARRRDRKGMVAILRGVEVEDAEATADTILANPTRYGY